MFDATSNGYPTFHVIDSEEYVPVNYINQSPLRTPKNREYDGTLHFPLHTACFKIVERFIAAQNRRRKILEIRRSRTISRYPRVSPSYN